MFTQTDSQFWNDPSKESRASHGLRFIQPARLTLAPYPDSVRTVKTCAGLEV